MWLPEERSTRCEAAVAMTDHNYDEVLNAACVQYKLDPHGYHGPSHWLRVETFSRYLADQTGADVTVVRLFARLHDCCRANENWDPDHGHRAADFAASLRGTLLRITDVQFELLAHAMRYHNDGLTIDDPTVGTCWDADRLDLGRVGVEPDPRFMSTAVSKLPYTLQWATEVQMAEGVYGS